MSNATEQSFAEVAWVKQTQVKIFYYFHFSIIFPPTHPHPLLLFVFFFDHPDNSLFLPPKKSLFSLLHPRRFSFFPLLPSLLSLQPHIINTVLLTQLFFFFFFFFFFSISLFFFSLFLFSCFVMVSSLLFCFLFFCSLLIGNAGLNLCSVYILNLSSILILWLYILNFSLILLSYTVNDEFLKNTIGTFKNWTIN